MGFNEIGVHLIRVNPGHICASHLSSHDHYFNHRHTILPLLLSIEITSTDLLTPILHVHGTHHCQTKVQNHDTMYHDF